MSRLGSLALAAVALAAVAAVAFFVARPFVGPVARPTPPATATPGATATATAPPSPSPAGTLLVYFARDGLPPVAGPVRSSLPGASIDDRLATRLRALLGARADETPPGAANAASGSGVSVTGATLAGDIVTVTLEGAPSVRGAAAERAFVQQLVYTATEEPGARRARFVDRSGAPVRVDQTVLDRPLAREDVHGYDLGRAATEQVKYGDPTLPADLGGRSAIRWSVDEVTPALARVVLELRPVPGAPPPQAIVAAEPVRDPRTPADGKWRLRVDLPEVRWNDASGGALRCCVTIEAGKTPLRKIVVSPVAEGRDRGVTVDLHLDDLRPWRVINVHGSPHRFTIDVGGHPRAVSDSVIVHAPLPGAEVPRSFRVTGAVRSFEATVNWVVRDAAGTKLQEGFGTASEGTSAAFGAFDLAIALPATAPPQVTLEVLWYSPRDGSPVGTVAIPLRLR